MKTVPITFIALAFLGGSITSGTAQKAWETWEPLNFYIAQGPEGSCGDGCSKWIAAEGTIGPNSAAHLRTFLTRLGQERLPIFFNSPGGLLQESFVIGRLLRERAMTASVGWTLVEGCDQLSKEAFDKCDALKGSGKKLPARIRTGIGGCYSACVTAFLGAKTRWVHPDSRLSVHASKPVVVKGKLIRQRDPADKSAPARNERSWRDYVREMGIKQDLVDTSLKTPHQELHHLTRDEIINFGIDPRQSLETPWTYIPHMEDRGVVEKLLVETVGNSQKEFPTSKLEFSCSGFNLLSLNYFRGLSKERARTPRLELVAGSLRTQMHFRESAPNIWIEMQREFERYTAFPDRDFIASAKTNGISVNEIRESAAPSGLLTIAPAGFTEAFDKFKCS